MAGHAPAKSWILYTKVLPVSERSGRGLMAARNFLELVALPGNVMSFCLFLPVTYLECPVVHGPRDLETPMPVILFQAPDKVTEA